MTDAEPVLVFIDMSRFMKSRGRGQRWQAARIGLGLAELRRVTRSGPGEVRYLEYIGTIRLDPPQVEPHSNHRPRRRPHGVYYPPLVPPPTSPRACMTCGVTFASEGPHHRLCVAHRKERADTIYGAPTPFDPDV